jgi:hypothetical protein
MARDPKDDPAHIPVEKRLSGDFGSPLEVMADVALTNEKKRAILMVWLDDLGSPPDSSETRGLRESIHAALASLEGQEK